MNKILKPSIIFLIFLLSLSGCTENGKNSHLADEDNATVRLIVMTWGGAAPGFVGQAKDFFGDFNIEISVVDDSTARVDVFSDYGDIYLTNPDQIATDLVQRGISGQMIQLSDISAGADGMLVTPEINKLSDLRGKTIAYVQGSAAALMLEKALEMGGVSRNEVTLIPVDDPSISVNALGRGGIDAVVTWEPLLSEAASQEGAKILFTSADIPATIFGVFVAKDAFIQRAEALEAFMNGWNDSVNYVLAHPEDSLPLIAEGFRLSNEQAHDLMQGLTLASAQLNKEWMLDLGNEKSKLAAFAMESAEYWKEIGLFDKTVSEEDYIIAQEAQAIIDDW